MVAAQKAYEGLAMEGPIATWYARNTARDQRRFSDVARAIAVRVKAGSQILEVAPGPGYLAIELAKRGCAVTAMDISRTFVQIARKNAADAGVHVTVELGNASAMPFADASFDYIVCMAAFKNFSDPMGAINEIHRVLRPEGVPRSTTCARTLRRKTSRRKCAACSYRRGTPSSPGSFFDSDC